jgi:hypothetical protein
MQLCARDWPRFVAPPEGDDRELGAEHGGDEVQREVVPPPAITADPVLRAGLRLVPEIGDSTRIRNPRNDPQKRPV